MPGHDFRTKIVDLPHLLRIRQVAAADRRTVVLCHGCFDIVHPGHVRYLHFARQQGDILIVSMTSDAAIDKGPLRPYIPQELRAENLAALECVDYVYVDPHPTASALLESVQPDIYIKGGEYETSQDPRFLRERATVESYGGRIVFSSGQPVFSSSYIISHMADEQSLAGTRLAAISEKTDVELLPLQVAEAFYRVRFGRLPLDSAHREAIEQALAKIAACSMYSSPGTMRSMVGVRDFSSRGA